MTWWKYIILGLTAFGGGSVISAAVFALIASTGVITRMAGKTHTGKHVTKYETAVVAGGTLWNIFWVFSVKLHVPVTVSGSATTHNRTVSGNLCRMSCNIFS